MSIGKSIQEAVSTAIRDVAPTVARELIPGSALAGRALREVSQVLTGKPDAPAETVRLNAESMTAEQVAALEGLEAKRVERERIAASDRASARDMHIRTGSMAPLILTAATGAALVGMLILLVFYSPPMGSESIVYGGVGILGTAFISGVQFLVGSSVGSKEKTAMMSGRR